MFRLNFLIILQLVQVDQNARIATGNVGRIRRMLPEKIPQARFALITEKGQNKRCRKKGRYISELPS